MEKDSRIYVPGHTGLLGSAIVRALRIRGYSNIIVDNPHSDLRNPMTVHRLFNCYFPEYVFMAAARVGNIAENIKYPVGFLSDNILIQNNVFAVAQAARVKKLIFFSSNCCYPGDCAQPMKEEYFMTGPLERTNEAYALAKIIGMKSCQGYNHQYKTQFISVVLASLYGPNDHFGTSRAHVIADMIHKLHQAKEDSVETLIFWGDGSPLREYIYVDDAADAAIFMMDNFNISPQNNIIGRTFLNAGTGSEISIMDLAHMISGVVGYTGKINWDTSKANGMPRKFLDSSKINVLGWYHKTGLEDGIRKTYEWYLKNMEKN